MHQADKRRRRRNTLDGKNSRPFQFRSSFSNDVVESNWGQRMFRGSLLFRWPATQMKSPNDYDEGNEREHRRYRTSHISRTPRQITTSNSFLRFSVWSFPTSAEQIQQASSHLAVAINNFHNCQVTFNVIKSPKSSDQQKLSVRGNYYGTISNLSSLNWFFMLLI